MEIIVESCAGLDVHKKTVMVCVRQAGHKGRAKQQVRQFGTATRQLEAMAEWLKEHGVTHVAMESTGVYWKPIWNMLEGRFELLLVNPQHIKKVAGRKTDVKDCEWIAQLLQHGLLSPSFVPPRPVRELRELTRHRAQLVDEKNRVANRLQKVLEDANIKLTSVASDLLGVSGRAMLEALCAGEQDPAGLAELARGNLRRKMPELREALFGHVTQHHRFMLRTLMQHLRSLEELEAGLSTRIEELVQHSSAPTPPPPHRGAEASESAQALSPTDASAQAPPAEAQAPAEPAPDPQQPPAPLSFSEAVQLLDTLPGVDQRAAQCLVAELGNNMAQFPDSAHLASWAKVCPGNNESAGKRKASPTGKGNRWLRRSLGQAACSAARQRKSYFSALFRRLAARRGKARAVIAVAHSMLVAIFHMLTHRVPFQDLGPDFFERRNPERLARSLVRRLEALGHQVILQPQGASM